MRTKGLVVFINSFVWLSDMEKSKNENAVIHKKCCINGNKEEKLRTKSLVASTNSFVWLSDNRDSGTEL